LDADRGQGLDQPGGWIGNILPYIEETAFHASMSDGDPATMTPTQLQGASRIISSPITIITCPARRDGGPYLNGTRAINSDANPTAGRSDYGINAGSQLANEVSAGPANLSEGENFHPDTRSFSGVSFVKSKIGIRKIPDGTSKTLLVMEKYIRSDHYTTGQDWGDNETWCTGFNNDNFRTTFFRPEPDKPSPQDNRKGAGSAHTSGVQVCFVDGSARLVSYDIDLVTWRAMGHRDDGAAALSTE
jgi:hypothetical protein